MKLNLNRLKKMALVREAQKSFALATIIVLSSPAYAQFEKADETLNTVADWLLTIGVIIITIAIMFVGFRMMFQAAQWRDVAPVFWGGILVGSASTIAGMFI